MARYALWVFVLAAVIGCTAASRLRTSLLTSPPGYLETFPLDAVSEARLWTEAGPPDRTARMGEQTWSVYQLGTGFGMRTFTYILSDGLPCDALYNDGDTYNGSRARLMPEKGP